MQATLACVKIDFFVRTYGFVVVAFLVCFAFFPLADVLRRFGGMVAVFDSLTYFSRLFQLISVIDSDSNSEPPLRCIKLFLHLPYFANAGTNGPAYLQ